MPLFFEWTSKKRVPHRIMGSIHLESASTATFINMMTLEGFIWWILKNLLGAD